MKISTWICRVIFVAYIVQSPLLYAQFSPGDLSSAHQHLSGISKCTNCHVLGKGERAVDEKCLDCHKNLATRINAGEGYHARVKGACADCHSEHNGVSYQLIHWDPNHENFDHSQTGYLLRGKHQDLKCRQCHTSKYIADKDVIQWESDHTAQYQDSTYLGLPTRCLGCHEDYHQGQLSNDCQTCHTEDDWKTAPKFDHAKTDFSLTGKHEKVKCKDCHKPKVFIAGEKPTPQFTKIPFQKCTDCHEDVHKGQFGSNCTKCHTPADWKTIRGGKFNHDLTDYPLRGKHVNVACEKCHLPGKPKKPLPHSKCTDCHDDYHKGQFAHRTTGINCEPCHSVQGFVPAKYTVSQHNKTDFPLTGAHQAQPCIACHTKPAGQAEIFHWDPLKCTSCHVDIHKGQFANKLKGHDCDVCHRLTEWADLKFSHEDTDFPLRGAHRTVQCVKCHTPEDPSYPDSPVRYAGVETSCNSCHTDEHQGQFAQADGNTDCERCHTASAWKSLKFDHDTMSRFPLKGKHENVACNKCHPSVTGLNGKSFIRYKPLGTECRDCHDFTNM